MGTRPRVFTAAGHRVDGIWLAVLVAGGAFIAAPAAGVAVAQPPDGDNAQRPAASAATDAEQTAPAGAAGSSPTGPESPEEIAWFERRIRPLLARHCFECHSAQAEEPAAGLRLDRRAELLRGGDLGPALVPGKPDVSLLVRAVRYSNTDLQMPPSGRLGDRDIKLLEEWIRRGAAFPADSEANETNEQHPARAKPDLEAARTFWSFQPVRRQELPRVRDSGWSRRRIDPFVLAALQQQGLAPSPRADRRTLIRRATFDLLGLPPRAEDVRAFVEDDSPDAYRRLVDRLLASPHLGEQWGRHWLDVARYTDATASWLKSTGQAWLYRDWVVQALNADLPYDEFVKRQLAADKLDRAGPRDRAALGFLGLSPTYWKEPRLAPDVIKTVVAEEWEERIDAVCRSFLGLTVACARCHDHKFDPITSKDYYALAGVFASTRLADLPLIPDHQAERVEAAKRRVAEIDGRIAKLEKDRKKSESDRHAALDQQLAEAQEERQRIVAETPHWDMPQAHGVDDASLYVLPNGPDQTRLEYKPGKPRDVALQVRGNPSNAGEIVPRRFLSVFADGAPRPFVQGSGRGELAEALFDEARWLTARVIVNRVWTWHFGRGLVTTPSNFGSQGERPSHPELLDDLAARLIEHDWSLKWLHRELMLSATYQQASRFDRAGNGRDPENRLLWRMNRRRLAIEPWRDAILSVSRSLEPQVGGPAQPLDARPYRRTIYARIERRDLDPLLRLYDFPPPTAHSPGRTPTTTPLQQLFVLNSDFFQEQSRQVVDRVLAETPDARQRIERLYERLFQRAPGEDEVRWARDFLSGAPSSGDERERWVEYVHVLLGSNEFMFID